MKKDLTPEELLRRRDRSNRITLKVILVLSFINTGVYLVSELLSGFLLPQMTAYVEAHADLVPDEYGILLERAFSIPQWYYLLCALLDAVSVAGLVLMWRLRKNGFHCYTLAKLLLMLMPMLFLGRSFTGIGNIMIGLFFIVYYFILLKSLGAFAPAGAAGEAANPEERAAGEEPDDAPDSRQED